MSPSAIRSGPLPPPSAPGPAVSLVVRRASKAYDVGAAHASARIAVLRDVTLHVGEGECVAIHGGGVGPLTLLRCAAGLVRPDAGSVAWRDRRGARAAPPAPALVSGDWRAAAACHTARDVLEAAQAHGVSQAEADRRVDDAALACGVRDLLGRRVAALPPPHRWRVGLAAAVAGGAGWLLLELPPCAWDDRGAGATGAARADRLTLLALRARGHTIIVSVPPGREALVPASRVLLWRDGRAWPTAGGGAAVPGAGRRVAEAAGADPSPLTLARGPV